jgi:hypothetical protein
MCICIGPSPSPNAAAPGGPPLGGGKAAVLGGTGRLLDALGSGDMSEAMEGREGRSDGKFCALLASSEDMASGWAGSKGRLEGGDRVDCLAAEGAASPARIVSGPGLGFERLARGSPVADEELGRCEGAAASGGGVAGRGGGEGIKA